MTRRAGLMLASAALAVSTTAAAALDPQLATPPARVLPGTDSTAAAEAAAATRLAPDVGAGPDAEATVNPAVEAALAALASGNPARAIGSGGGILGHIDSATVDDRGLGVFSLLLDPSLGLQVERVTYGGEAMVAGEGEIMLQVLQADMVGAIEDWIQARD